ncbi:MAG: radical SAM protein [Deltaproteobacteria bacterium]|nr:radical SAM protein [Deltaproteobacteria bacterium]
MPVAQPGSVSDVTGETLPDTFEIGPIRPPSEAGSYLLRLTRGCPWNRCRFCRSYKRHRFSLRSVDEIRGDIDAMARARDRLRGLHPGGPRGAVRAGLVGTSEEWQVANALAAGGRTAFLQDADSLVMRPPQVREVLAHFRLRFPEVDRITTYARSHTLARLSADDLSSYRELGLTRIHVGLESGCDALLRLIQKGASAEIHVRAGRAVVEAGLELSEYVMPGLGGRELSEAHARETATVLGAIDPHFIRLRTLCLGPKLALWEEFQTGRLTRQTDVEILGEVRAFVEALEGIRSRLTSDHVLNLLGDLEGTFPADKPRLLAQCDAFLSLPAREQRLFQVGRRAGLLEGLRDLQDPGRRASCETLLGELTEVCGPDGIEEGVRSMLQRFV